MSRKGIEMKIDGSVASFSFNFNKDAVRQNEASSLSRFATEDTVEISSSQNAAGRLPYPPYSEPPPIGDPDD